MQVKLKVLNGSSAGRELKVAQDEFLIGRSDSCQLRPKSDSISRRHCAVRLRDNRVFVEDLGSRNGTFLNQVRLEAETEAKHGDVLRVGKLELRFEIHQPVPASQAPQSPVDIVNDDSVVNDDDITKWLNSDEAGPGTRQDPDTRQFRLDETERVALETVVSPPNETEAPVKPADSAAEAADKDKEKEKEKKPEKKVPGKLPPRQAAATATSRDAAADMLKRFFNRP